MTNQMMTPQELGTLRSELMGHLIKGADIGLLFGALFVAVAYLLGAGFSAQRNLLIVFCCAGWSGLAVYGYQLMKRFLAK